MTMKLNAQELRVVADRQVEQAMGLKRHPVYLVLENVYDTYNVGGLFRLADALAVEKIYLCGEMEIPPNPKIKKASIGTYKIVPWEYKHTAKEAIEELRSMSFLRKQESSSRSRIESGMTNKIQIIAIEQSEKAVEYTKTDYSFPIAFIVGNETSGVLPDTLALVDQIVEIPMWGINKSLNVIVSAAIVTYWAMSHEPEVGIEPTVFPPWRDVLPLK